MTKYKTIWWSAGQNPLDIACLTRWTTLGWGYYDSHRSYLNLAEGGATNSAGLLTNLGQAGQNPTNSHFTGGSITLQLILTAASICQNIQAYDQKMFDCLGWSTNDVGAYTSRMGTTKIHPYSYCSKQCLIYASGRRSRVSYSGVALTVTNTSTYYSNDGTAYTSTNVAQYYGYDGGGHQPGCSSWTPQYVSLSGTSSDGESWTSGQMDNTSHFNYLSGIGYRDDDGVFVSNNSPNKCCQDCGNSLGIYGYIQRNNQQVKNWRISSTLENDCVISFTIDLADYDEVIQYQMCGEWDEQGNCIRISEVYRTQYKWSGSVKCQYVLS